MQIDATTSLWIVAAGAIIVVAAIILRKYLNVDAGKSIMVLQPRDKRFFDLPILRETEAALEAKRKGINHRYYKSGPGWSSVKGATRFIGIEGNAYTAVVVDDKNVTMRLPQAMKILWGDFYKKLPEPQRTILENHVFGVTVKPDEIPLEDKSRKASAENIDKDNIEIATDALGKRLKKKGKMDWIQLLYGFCVGGFVIYVLVNLKFLPVAR